MTENDPNPGRSPEPGAEVQRLRPFVGSWRAEGKSYAVGQVAANPRASSVPWRSDETYEWLPGGFFLLHRWDAMVGTYMFRGTEIIGYDPRQGRYFTQFFDNAGNHAEYQVVVDGNTWTFSEPATRVAATFANDGNELDFRWEWMNAGSDWLPLCERTARRMT